jgi:hypothetical protein
MIVTDPEVAKRKRWKLAACRPAPIDSLRDDLIGIRRPAGNGLNSKRAMRRR